MGTRPGGRTGLGPTFRALLAATAVSNLGDGVRLAALPLLATTFTDSPLLIAGVTAAQFLPWPVFGPVGGVIVDRADRRRLILVTQAWRAVVMVGLAAAVITDTASIWMVFVVAFTITVGEILVDPSVVAIVPTLVRPHDLDRANGRVSTVEIVTNDVIGAPAGAALFIVAPWLPFVIDGLSYFGSIMPFRRMPSLSGSDRVSRRAGGGLLTEVSEGARWLWRHPMLRPWTLAVAVFNIGAAAAFSLIVELVLDVHAGSEVAFGVTLAVAAVAGALGSSSAARLVQRYGRRSVLLTATGLEALSLVALAGAPSLTTVVVVWSFGAAFSGVLLAIGRGFVQRYCPDELLGRAAIASRTITRSAFVVGAMVGGTVATGTGIRSAYLVAGAVQAAALVPMAMALRHDADGSPKGWADDRDQ
ncbi:MAG: MFS transporter [Actinomycetota bacterium]